MPATPSEPIRRRAGDSGVHLAELMAALSIATYLRMGQPLESGLCSCFVATRGLVEVDETALRRAGLLHDIGRVDVSAGVWGKAGALSDREWEEVRLHGYYPDRVLAGSCHV
jgi:response regulator RpfG family c-di-GMP phosphodiesterase